MCREVQEAEAGEISEEEISALVRDAQRNNSEAFAQLLGLLEARLHRQALFLARDEHQALDLLQETMVETWKHIGRYDGRARFFAWVCRIMLHRHYDWLRRLRTRASAAFRAATDEAAQTDSSCPRQASTDAELARIMGQALDRLPARQRSVVYLRFYAGESLEGIAATLGCSVGTVKSRLFHALKRLAGMEKLSDLQKDLEG